METLGSFFCEYVQKRYGSGGVRLPLDEQAGHTAQTAAQKYALAKSDLRGLDRHPCKAYFTASQAWHVVFGCDKTRPWNLIPTMETDSDKVTITDQDERKSGTNIISISKLVPPAATGSSQFIPIHDPYHPKTAPHKTVSRPEPPSSMEHTMAAYTAMKDMGYDGWSSEEQGMAATLIVENQQSIGVILPTGGGKSLLFYIPCILFPTKCTVLIVFLSELRTAHLLEAERKGIQCSLFGNARSFNCLCPPTLLILGPEQANCHEFQCILRSMAIQNKLFAIFFDEIHLILEPYRDVMTRLQPLGAVGVPFVATTATLKPGEEYSIHLRIGRELTWIRSTTVRSNIAYTIEEEEDDIDQVLFLTLQSWSCNRSDTRERAILYCWTKAEVERMYHLRMGKGLLCGMGHSGMGHTINLDQRQRFEGGEFLIYVTYPLLGCGYNYPFVTMVLHRAMARSMKDYIQQSGRAGRSGQFSQAKIVTNQGAISFLFSQFEREHGRNGDMSGLNEMKEYISNRIKCPCWIIHSIIDGRPTQCWFANGNKGSTCDVCEAATASNQHQEALFPRGRLASTDICSINQPRPDVSPLESPNHPLGQQSRVHTLTTPATTGLVHGLPLVSQSTPVLKNPYRKIVTPASNSFHEFKKSGEQGVLAHSKRTGSESSSLTGGWKISLPDTIGNTECPVRATGSAEPLVHFVTNPYQKRVRAASTSLQRDTPQHYSQPHTPANVTFPQPWAYAAAATFCQTLNNAKQSALKLIELLDHKERCLPCYLLAGRESHHNSFSCPTISVTAGKCIKCLGEHFGRQCLNVRIPTNSNFCFKCGL